MDEPIRVCVSYLQVEPLMRAREAGERTATISLNLGQTREEVVLEADGVVLPGGQKLAWDKLEPVLRNRTACFAVVEGTVERVQRFSEHLNRAYALMPTEGAPTMLVSGIPMHRIRDMTPDRDTVRKIRCIAPVRGRVLDTCTGLGYTAIEAARTAEQVVTVELDPVVLEIAALNPWSRDLFGNPRIRQIIGDVAEEVGRFGDAAFQRIIHDPPTFSLAGELYSGECYRQFFRILDRGGRMYHYVGDLESRSGRNVARGAARRLQEAGFSRVRRVPDAFGLVAYK